MIRTQVQLVPEQAAALKRTAAERGVSMAEIVREAVGRYLASEQGEPRKQRAIEAIGGFRSGHHDVSVEHDRHVADAFAE